MAARALLVAAIGLLACSSCTVNRPTKTVTVSVPVTATATVTTSVTDTVTPEAVTQTIPAAAQPTTAPQGTVTYAVQNNTGYPANCSATRLEVHNQSDTPTLSITVTFKPTYNGFLDSGAGFTSVDMPETAPETKPAGIPAYGYAEVDFQVCESARPTALAHARDVSVDAVPVTFTWQWRQ